MGDEEEELVDTGEVEGAEPVEPAVEVEPEDFEAYLEKTPPHKTRHEALLTEREEFGKQVGRNEGFQSAQELRVFYEGRSKALTDARAAWDQLAGVFNDAVEAGVVDNKLRQQITRLVPNLAKMELLNQEALQQGAEEKAGPIARQAQVQGLAHGYNAGYWDAVGDVLEAAGELGQYEKLAKRIGPHMPWAERRRLTSEVSKKVVDGTRNAALSEGGKLDLEKAKIAARARGGPEIGGRASSGRPTLAQYARATAEQRRQWRETGVEPILA